MSLLTCDELSWLASLHLGQIVSVQPFNHALTNEVFLVTDKKGQQLIFKRLNVKARDKQDRERELAIHKLASERGVTPKVVGASYQYRAQEYIKGITLDNSVCTIDTLELFARQLQRIHQLPAKYAQPQRLAIELRLLKKRLNRPIDEGKFQHFLQLAIALDNSSANNILCHGDLSFNNLLQAENGDIKILDWEYAVLACPAYDLAACAAINALTAVQQQQLINHYYYLHQNHLALSLAQLHDQVTLYHSLFNYLNELWEVCFLEK